jgi:hypothetical protein
MVTRKSLWGSRNGDRNWLNDSNTWRDFNRSMVA